MRARRALTSVLALTLLFASSASPQHPDHGEGVEARVNDLLARMTLDEKLGLLAGVGFDTAPVPRLGIPAFRMVDGPAGVRAAPATSFPAGIALAASFDPPLVRRVAAAIAREAKAKGKNVLLAPCVNILRAPHGGRNFESFGEDPALAARTAVAYVQGVQGEGVLAAVKHYAVNNQEKDRMSIDAQVDERTLHEIYLPAFKAAVAEGGAWSVMAAYNRVNGRHATENRVLLTDILKDRWSFRGLVMSDWTAVRSTVPTLQAGLDLEMPTAVFLKPERVRRALDSGEVSAAAIDDKVRRILRTMAAMGFLDREVPEGGALDTPEHRQVALDAARAGIVLLKNERGVLPLDAKRLRQVAIIGPNAAVARLGGGGSAKVVPLRSVSPLEGVTARLGASVRIEHAPGLVALEDTTPIPVEALRHPASDEPGLLAEYFTNLELSGEPAVRRVEPRLEFRWATGAPLPDFPADRFSTRFTGRLVAPSSGTYVLSLASNDGGRLFLDDRKIVDLWSDHATMTGTAVVELKAGEPRKIRVEHYENVGNADLVLGWRRQEGDTLRRAVEAAAHADAAVVFVGLSEATETEAQDRPDLHLPAGQDELVAAVAAANPNTVVVVSGGGPLLMDAWLDRVPGVLHAFYLGQAGGTALAEVLFGDVSPSGKLPLTLPRRFEDSPAFGRYPGSEGVVRYDEGMFVGYRHFDRAGIAPLFPFGHGLSYGRFEYAGLSLPRELIAPGAPVLVAFELANVGSRDAAEVAQVYVRDLTPSRNRPMRELRGFRKVALRAGETQRVTVELTADAFAQYDVARSGWFVQPGPYEIEVGSSSRDIRLRGRIERGR
jgi:beta-glucosidase